MHVYRLGWPYGGITRDFRRGVQNWSFFSILLGAARWDMDPSTDRTVLWLDLRLQSGGAMELTWIPSVIPWGIQPNLVEYELKICTRWFRSRDLDNLILYIFGLLQVKSDAQEAWKYGELEFPTPSARAEDVRWEICSASMKKKWAKKTKNWHLHNAFSADHSLGDDTLHAVVWTSSCLRLSNTIKDCTMGIHSINFKPLQESEDAAVDSSAPHS